MTKDNPVNIKMDVKTALEVLQVLDSSVAGYSEEFPPERIVRLRKVMWSLDKELEKHIL